MDTIFFLNICNITVIISKNAERTYIRTCFKLNGLSQRIIAVGSFYLFQEVSAFLETQDSQLTVFLRNNQVVLFNGITFVIDQVCGQNCGIIGTTLCIQRRTP